MSLANVLANIEWRVTTGVGDLSVLDTPNNKPFGVLPWLTSEKNAIISALTAAYNASTSAAALMEEPLGRGPLRIIRKDGSGELKAFYPDQEIYLDPREFDGNWDAKDFGFFSAKGEVFKASLQRVLMHEMNHAIRPQADGALGVNLQTGADLFTDANIRSGTSGFSATTGLSGPTVGVENKLMAEIAGADGTPEFKFWRGGYKGVAVYSRLPSEMSDLSWTGFRLTDVVIVDNRTADGVSGGDSYSANIDLTNVAGATANSPSRDLVVAQSGNDKIDGGKGDDYLYGGRGADTLIGSEGNNWIIGGDQDKGVDIADYTDRIGTLKVTTATFKNDDGSNQFDKKAIDIGHGADLTGGNKEFHDTLREVEVVLMPGYGEGGKNTSKNPFANTYEKSGDVWKGVRFYDSAGTGETDKIILKNDPGATDFKSENTPTQFNFGLEDAVRNARVDVTVDPNIASSVRANNALFVNDTQLAGGARFILNRGDSQWSTEYKYGLRKSPLQFERKETLTQKEFDDIVTKETARYNGALGPDPGVGGILGDLPHAFWLSQRHANKIWVQDWLTDEYYGSAQDYPVIGQQGEVYVFRPLNADGTRTLEVRFYSDSRALMLTVTIDKWRDGDFGIKKPSDTAYDSKTSGDGKADTSFDIKRDVLLNALSAEKLITDPDQPPQPNNGNNGPGAPPPGAPPPNPGPGDPPPQPNLQRLGDDGNNQLDGASGDDKLIGNKGNDTLKGEDGNDTYIFNPGDGQDVIEDGAGQNKISIAASLSGVDAELIANADGTHDLRLTYPGGNTIVVKGFFDAANGLNWSFAGSDGVYQSARQFLTAHSIDLSSFVEAVGNAAPVVSTITESFAGKDGEPIVGQVNGATDANGDNLQYLLQTTASYTQHGTVTLDPVSRRFVFTPTEGYSGPAQFAYYVSDGFQVSATRVVGNEPRQPSSRRTSSISETAG